MVGLTSILRSDAERIWRRIFEHPFVLELYRGVLPLEKFRFYVVQDYNYLLGVLRAFSLVRLKQIMRLLGLPLR